MVVIERDIEELNNMQAILKEQAVSEQKKPVITNLGRHVLAEFYGCNSNVLNNCELIEQEMVNAAKECGATVVEKNFHMFSPFGVSGVVIIAESHLAIHTWPEHEYAAVDLFTCGDTCNPLVAYEYLKEKLGAGNAIYSELQRGILNPEKNNEVMVSPFQIKTHID